MAAVAQSASVLRIVRVCTIGDELAPVAWPVVGVGAALPARCAMPVACRGAGAVRVSLQHTALEPGVVLPAVAALPERAALLLYLACAVGASASHWLGAARARVHGSGHGTSQAWHAPAVWGCTSSEGGVLVQGG